ncbi:MAG: hypothetical protein BHW56_02360 [Acetobacter sp. 46_36]|nr:MAG: hypothetical protein BHW56_02360 [Acetobacter sp. 46_36]
MPRLTAALQRGFLFVSGRENRWGAADGSAKRQSAGGSAKRQPAGGSVRRQPAGGRQQPACTDSNRRAQTAGGGCVNFGGVGRGLNLFLRLSVL